MPKGDRLTELVDVMDRLLAPDGCPWDREQDLISLKPYLIEEAYEVIDAIDHGDTEAHREELGDLLMQVVFQAALREREQAFDIDGVVGAIVDKMVHRHPHVFGDKQLSTAEEVNEQWNRLKRAEKDRRTLDGIPRALPALARARKLSERAAEVGFDWPDVEQTRAKVSEELAELDEAIAAGAPAAIFHELGDLLFAIVSLARKLGLHQGAEGALAAANTRFTERFEYVEDGLAARGKTPVDSTLAEMDALWEQAKQN